MLWWTWILDADASDWRDLPWMTATPAELLDAAKASTNAGDVDVLADDRIVIITADGRREVHRRLVFEVLTRDGADQFGTIAAEWADWYQERPALDARVITPTGEVVLFRQADVAEGRDDGKGLILSDTHTLRGPLPGLVPGAVVERTIVTREHAPFLATGAVTAIPLSGGFSGVQVRRRITYPAGVPFTWRVEGIDLKPVEGREGDLRVLSIAYDTPPAAVSGAPVAADPLGLDEPGLPGEVRAPTLVFSTARSWQAVATDYAGLVEGALSGQDLAATAAAARGDATDRREVIARLLAHVQRYRYVGVELGRNAIVPVAPSELAARGYGDCKDKATLLVGLLRASGIPAHVALLRTGPDVEVYDLPGIDHFDHAIVYLPGKDEQWIDPTSDFAGVGDLPWADQGRLALVAAPDTRGLRRIPVLPPSANAVRIQRTVQLQARGTATIDVEQTLAGWPAQRSRARFDAGDPAHRDEVLSYEVEKVYTGEAVADVQVADPRDLTTPHSFSFQVRGASYGYGVNGEAAARFNLYDELLDRLPTALTQAPDPGARGRLHAYEYAPYQATSEQVVLPPPGYVAAPLPEAIHWAAADLKLDVTFRVRDDGAVVALATFDTGDGRLTAEAFTTVQAALQTLFKADNPMITFRHPGALALQESRVADALREYRTRYEAAPTDVDAIDGWAWALSEAGFNEPARALIDEAARLAPTDRWIRERQALIALRDDDGRFGKGPPGDRTTAIAATEAMVAHPASASRGWLWLAIATEVGDDGRMLGAGSDPDRAIDALHHYRETSGATDTDDTLVRYLIWRGRWEDLAKLADQLPPGPVRDATDLTLAARQGGAFAAFGLRAPAITEPSARSVALATAGDYLVIARDYALAAALIEAAAHAAANPMATRDRAKRLRDLERHEDLKLSDNDPDDLTARWVLATLVGGPADLDEVTAPARRGGAAPLAQELKGSLLEIQVPHQMPHDAFADILLGMLVTTVEGSAATGWRIQLQDSASGAQYGALYAVRERGRVYLRATSAGPAEMGAEALERVERGDVAAARQWLEWAHRDAATGRPDPTTSDPFRVAWSATEDRARIHALAAMLAASSPARAAAAVGVLESAAFPEDPAFSFQVQRAAFTAQRQLGHLDSARATAASLSASHPESSAIGALPVLAALAAHDGPEALREARALRDRLPDDPQVLGLYARVVGTFGDVTDAHEAFLGLHRTGRATESDYNAIAWKLAFAPGYAAQAVEYATQASQLGGWKQEATLHTLAVALLAADRPTEAREVFLKGLETHDPTDPAVTDGWNYVRGRLAETWGLPDLAEGYFAKIPPPGPDDLPDSMRVIVAARAPHTPPPGSP